MRRTRWLPLELPTLAMACTESGALGPLSEASVANAALNSGPSMVFPSRISLPNGFQPEGIVIGRGTTFYVGSLAGPYMGAIYRGDLRTGTGAILVPASQTGQAVGLNHDNRTDYLFVAGGGFKAMFVYEGATGATIAVVPLPSAALINDLVITRDAVYLTDSFRPVIYRVALGAGGRLLPNSTATEIPLTGDYVFNPNAETGSTTTGS